MPEPIGGRWRLQLVDGEESDDGFDAYQICKISDEDSEIVLSAWSEEEARYAIAALRWYDSFLEDKVSIPVPPAPKPKTRARKVKVADE